MVWYGSPHKTRPKNFFCLSRGRFIGKNGPGRAKKFFFVEFYDANHTKPFGIVKETLKMIFKIYLVIFGAIFDFSDSKITFLDLEFFSKSAIFHHFRGFYEE